MKWGWPETSNMEGASGVAGGRRRMKEQRKGRAGEEGGTGVYAGLRWLVREVGEGRGHGECGDRSGGRVLGEGGRGE